MGIHGIDVSEFQGAIDWKTVSLHTTPVPIRFAVIRATVGTTGTDSRLRDNLARAVDNGLMLGVYAAPTPNTTPDAAKKDVDRLQKVLGNFVPHFVSLDAEVRGGLTAHMASEFFSDWVDAAEEWLTRAPVLYTYPDFWEGLAREGVDQTCFARCPLWLARYRTPAAYIPDGRANPKLLAPWDKVTMWQYSGSGGVRVAGIATDCDRDQFMGTETEFRDLCGLPKQPDTLPEIPIPVTLDPDGDA